MIRLLRQGRFLDDFVPGEVHAPPWEVTVDEGMLALFSASFPCAVPTYASREVARAYGLGGRPIHPILLLNLGISFSVHDVSERAIAHLAYIDVRFPNACYPGATLRASSRGAGAKPVWTGDRGVVQVPPEVAPERGVPVCAFDRKALVRGGSNADGPQHPPHEVKQHEGEIARAPSVLLGALADR